MADFGQPLSTQELSLNIKKHSHRAIELIDIATSMKRHMKSLCKQTVGFAKPKNGYKWTDCGCNFGKFFETSNNSDTWSLWSFHAFPCLGFSYTFSQQGTIRLWLPCHGSLYCRDPCPIEFQLEPKKGWISWDPCAVNLAILAIRGWLSRRVKTPWGPNILDALFAVETCRFSRVHLLKCALSGSKNQKRKRTLFQSVHL